jgi:hypothetical protein
MKAEGLILDAELLGKPQRDLRKSNEPPKGLTVGKLSQALMRCSSDYIVLVRQQDGPNGEKRFGQPHRVEIMSGIRDPSGKVISAVVIQE